MVTTRPGPNKTQRSHHRPRSRPQHRPNPRIRHHSATVSSQKSSRALSVIFRFLRILSPAQILKRLSILIIRQMKRFGVNTFVEKFSSKVISKVSALFGFEKFLSRFRNSSSDGFSLDSLLLYIETLTPRDLKSIVLQSFLRWLLPFLLFIFSCLLVHHLFRQYSTLLHENIALLREKDRLYTLLALRIYSLSSPHPPISKFAIQKTQNPFTSLIFDTFPTLKVFHSFFSRKIRKYFRYFQYFQENIFPKSLFSLSTPDRTQNYSSDLSFYPPLKHKAIDEPGNGSLSTSSTSTNSLMDSGKIKSHRTPSPPGGNKTKKITENTINSKSNTINSRILKEALDSFASFQGQISNDPNFSQIERSIQFLFDELEFRTEYATRLKRVLKNRVESENQNEVDPNTSKSTLNENGV